MEAILDILRIKMRSAKGGRDLAGTDDIVLLEQCTVKSLISYPDFIALVQILNVSATTAS